MLAFSAMVLADVIAVWQGLGMANEEPELTDYAKALLENLPCRVICGKRYYRVALALSEMGLVTLSEAERRGHVKSYLVVAK